MSVEAFAYVRRLAFGKNPGRKLVLANIAEAVDKETHSWVIRPATLAIESEMEQRQTQNHLKDLMQAGYISALERFNDQGKQRPSRMLMHGPWDLWGGTGTPFQEVILPRSERRLDAHQAREVDAETREEIRRRLQHIADREGFYADGRPRARWRLGSRAHSVVCWYGVGNTVSHRGQGALVLEITDRDGKKKAPLRVRLDYGDGTDAWVPVADLDEPADNTGSEKPSSEGMHSSAPTPVSGVQPSAPRPPHYSSESLHPQEKVPTQRVHSEEEEDSPSARTNGSASVELVLSLTDATAEEAAELVEIIRPEVKKSLGGLIRAMAKNGDLDQRLWSLRRQRASQARAAASESDGPDSRCGDHHEALPCGGCDGVPRPVLVGMLRKYGPVRRPDIAERLGVLAGASN